MAKQKGAHKILGTIGELTYYKTKDGYLIREGSPISASRIQIDPAFARTRENMSEFGRAGKAGKTLRNAVRNLLQNAKDSKVVSRLTTEMMKVIKADATSLRGQRNVIDGEAELLQGFDFNIDAKLSTTIYAPFTGTIDRVAGTATVNIPSFVPANQIVAPQGATHFKIVSMGAEVDFTAGTSITDAHESAVLPVDGNATAVLNLANALTANSTHPLFLLLGIQFFQQVNGVNYSLRNGAFNALGIAKVSGV
jgi:hypothetical protein